MRKYSADIGKMKPRTDIAHIYRRLGIPLEELKDIQQIHASDATIDLMYKVIRRGIRRKYRWMHERKQESTLSFHMLQWAPKTDNSIPLNEVWVYDLDENY